MTSAVYQYSLHRNKMVQVEGVVRECDELLGFAPDESSALEDGARFSLEYAGESIAVRRPDHEAIATFMNGTCNQSRPPSA